ncbi:MAG: bifunctional fucokinase/fucose-1-phosphate guanylyltransferase [Terrimicrobiaceae bacterium]
MAIPSDVPQTVQHLLSLPPAMAGAFHKIFPGASTSWFASCDPVGLKLGSGGGVAQILADACAADGEDFDSWLDAARRLVLLAGGQSRRLPAYAATGKVLMPVPVMRWSHGQRLDQTLLDMQVDDYTRILLSAPAASRVLVASGDVFLKFPDTIPDIPEADIVGFGMQVSPETASHFGVFFSPRESHGQTSFFLQKPSSETVRNLAGSHAYFVDTGLWLLSRRAIAILMKRCGWDGTSFQDGHATAYELYAGLGPSLGTCPAEPDPAISSLTVGVVPLAGAEFYHFGTTRQMIESLSALQNRVPGQADQTDFWRKTHPDMYVLNSDFAFSKRSGENRLLWIENSALPESFSPSHENAITGLPPGEWDFAPGPGQCVDCVPVGESEFVIRNYGFDDPFSGAISEALWMGKPAVVWFEDRGLSLSDAGIDEKTDIQEARLFAAVDDLNSAWIAWLLDGSGEMAIAEKWLSAPRFSARELGESINLDRLFTQRKILAGISTGSLWDHRTSNPFFRIDLENAASIYAAGPRPLPVPDDSGSNALNTMHEYAFASAVASCRGEDGSALERRAFSSLSERIVDLCGVVAPRNTLIEDQILWARSPVRLDLAGGWSDTPPFCLKQGGAVVNLGVDLNGQAPVQVFVRRCLDRHIVIRSIDLGAQTTIRSFEELENCREVGEEFSLAKAAFCLAGFHPKFHNNSPASLSKLLEEFGGGLELSLLAATPKGSGLGTSSVLAATILAALGATGGLGWSHEDLVQRTMALEQMLTSGGGWQDQAGGIYHGIKLIETTPGLEQKPSVRWLPEQLLGSNTANRMALLYYTGITRVAKTILQEIVRGMLLNSHSHMENLFAIRAHAMSAYQSIQRESWSSLCQVVERSWELNQALDRGTNPPEVAAIIASVRDWSAGGKLLGAGGGGYMLLLAKDEEAGNRMRQKLIAHPPNPRARFVDFSVSRTGLQITKS